MYSDNVFKVPNELSGGLHFFKGKRHTVCSDKQFPVYEPRTGRVVAQCPCADNEMVDIVVGQSALAQPQWAALSPIDRSKILLKAANLIRV
jgi:betaine-aldehyde dehydrogenase